MTIFQWLASRFSKRDSALSLYKRGMVRARKHDHQGAIDDYSAAIAMPNTPAEMKAMILFNRGLVRVAAGDEPQGTEDLNVVLNMDDASKHVRMMARQKLARMHTRSKKESR
jgi:hypothetical protein